MAYTQDELSDIYEKTGGYCACCGKKLAFTNYGLQGGANAKARWEVAHRRARSRGGSDADAQPLAHVCRLQPRHGHRACRSLVWGVRRREPSHVGMQAFGA